MVLIKRYFLLFLFVLPGVTSFAQQALVRAYVDKNKILLGKPLLLTVESRVPGNAKPQPFKIDSIPHFEFLKKDSTQKESAGGSNVLRQYYSITSFDSGQWVIPAFVLTAGIKTLPITIDVMFTDPFDPTQPYHDIQDVRDVPGSSDFEKWWYMIAGILILLTLIIYWLTRPRKPKPLKPAIKGDAYKHAIRKLEALKKGKQDEITFYTRLVQIFRTYVLERTGIESLQQTSTDLIAKLKPLYKSEANYESISNVLYLSDYVKFAKYDPEDSEATSAFEVVSQSIGIIEQEVKSNQNALNKNLSAAVENKEGDK